MGPEPKMTKDHLAPRRTYSPPGAQKPVGLSLVAPKGCRKVWNQNGLLVMCSFQTQLSIFLGVPVTSLHHVAPLKFHMETNKNVPRVNFEIRKLLWTMMNPNSSPYALWVISNSRMPLIFGIENTSPEKYAIHFDRSVGHQEQVCQWDILKQCQTIMVISPGGTSTTSVTSVQKRIIRWARWVWDETSLPFRTLTCIMFWFTKSFNKWALFGGTPGTHGTWPNQSTRLVCYAAPCWAILFEGFLCSNER